MKALALSLMLVAIVSFTARADFTIVQTLKGKDRITDHAQDQRRQDPHGSDATNDNDRGRQDRRHDHVDEHAEKNRAYFRRQAKAIAEIAAKYGGANKTKPKLVRPERR